MSDIVSKSAFPKTVQPGIPQLSAKPPMGWKRTSLGFDLYEQNRSVVMQDEKAYRLVTVKRARGGVVEREVKQGAEISVKTQFQVKSGDFLISKRQIVHGACGLVPSELDGSTVSNEYSVLRSRGNIDLLFLKYLSHSTYFQQTCFHSSVGVHIEKMIFKLDKWLSWEFDLPPLPEQRRIAEILSTWDQAIETTEKLIANSQAQKKALMQQLFPREGETTPRLRFPEFRDAGEWGIKMLGDVCNFLNNRRKPVTSAHRVNGIYPYYGASGIVDYVDQYIFDETTLLIGEDGAKWAAFEKTAFLVSGKYWVNNHAHVLTSHKISLSFLEAYITFLNLASYVTGAAPPKLTLAKLKSVPVTLASKKEQQKIADCLSVLDEMICFIQRKLELLKAQKNSLMQQLLTGKRRVSLSSVQGEVA